VIVQQQKRTELETMQEYAHGERCYMGFLMAQLGDQVDYKCNTCGYCCPQNFPPVNASECIQPVVTRFLEEEFLPCIEMRYADDGPAHEAGWALSYHKGTSIGRQVSASKYRSGGPFALGLVMRAVEILHARYPLQSIEGVVSVPPTRGSMLVEMFARQVAERLGIMYLPVLVKNRITKKQKQLTNRAQKMTNVLDAFNVLSPDTIRGRTLLLIDDIFDSGYTLYEVGKALMEAGARAVYPFTITRTAHSDDQ
jgi:ATP-dependent DNA helicase RecQ